LSGPAARGMKSNSTASIAVAAAGRPVQSPGRTTSTATDTTRPCVITDQPCHCRRGDCGPVAFTKPFGWAELAPSLDRATASETGSNRRRRCSVKYRNPSAFAWAMARCGDTGRLSKSRPSTSISLVGSRSAAAHETTVKRVPFGFSLAMTRQRCQPPTAKRPTSTVSWKPLRDKVSPPSIMIDMRAARSGRASVTTRSIALSPSAAPRRSWLTAKSQYSSPKKNVTAVPAALATNSRRPSSSSRPSSDCVWNTNGWLIAGASSALLELPTSRGQVALDAISPADTANWFRHCGYHMSGQPL